jgi:hypothetical protein
VKVGHRSARNALFVCVVLVAGACGGSSGAPVDGGGGGGGEGGGGGSSGDAGSTSANGCTGLQASCTITSNLSCTDTGSYDATELALFQTACAQQGGTWSTSACNTSSSVGGCKGGIDGGCNVEWVYPPATASGAMPACLAAGNQFTWVTP